MVLKGITTGHTARTRARLLAEASILVTDMEIESQSEVAP